MGGLQALQRRLAARGGEVALEQIVPQGQLAQAGRRQVARRHRPRQRIAGQVQGDQAFAQQVAWQGTGQPVVGQAQVAQAREGAQRGQRAFQGAGQVVPRQVQVLQGGEDGQARRDGALQALRGRGWRAR